MPYSQVADPRLDTDRPGTSVDLKKMRDNQDFFDSQITNIVSRGLISNQTIADDFLASSVGGWYSAGYTGGGGSRQIISEHTFQAVTTGNAATDFAGAVGDTEHIRIVKTEEYVALMEVRVKRPGTDADHYFFGWNDDGLGTGAANFSDHTNAVGVVREAASGNWQAVVQRSAGGTDASAAFGNAANWEVIKILLTCSATAGSRQVEFFLNGASQFTYTTDANIPTASLRPCFGTVGDTTGAASREILFDYVVFSLTAARPLAA